MNHQHKSLKGNDGRSFIYIHNEEPSVEPWGTPCANTWASGPLRPIDIDCMSYMIRKSGGASGIFESLCKEVDNAKTTAINSITLINHIAK